MTSEARTGVLTIKRKFTSFLVNTIKIFISCNENIQIFTRALHSWNTNVFITLDENINGIHTKE